MTSDEIGCSYGLVKIVSYFFPSLSTVPHYSKMVQDIIFRFIAIGIFINNNTYINPNR